jgi:hypothetical protein
MRLQLYRISVVARTDDCVLLLYEYTAFDITPIAIHYVLCTKDEIQPTVLSQHLAY